MNSYNSRQVELFQKKMFYEVIIGGLVGLATYMYLHYLNKNKQQKQLQQVKYLLSNALCGDLQSLDEALKKNDISSLKTLQSSSVFS